MAFDELLVRHCAPTLADLKIASLICIPKSVCGEEYEQIVSAYNDCYNGKGVYFRTLCICNRRRLLYVYRPCRVRAYLASPAAAAFLVECGFAREASLEEKLSLLADRFTSSNAFPHELGLFLGYPTADVEAFIVHGGSRKSFVVSGRPIPIRPMRHRSSTNIIAAASIIGNDFPEAWGSIH